MLIRGLLNPYTHAAVLGAVVILAFAARLPFLFLPIAFDEAHTFITYASKPLSEALSTYSAPNNHLFHTLLVHLVTRFSSAEAVIRIPAFGAGVAVVLAAYWLGRRLYSRDAGLLAAALTAGSSALIEYSTNARGYTLLTLFTLLLFVNATFIFEGGSWRRWATYALIAALGAYTLPIMLYPFAGISTWLAIMLRRSGQTRRLITLVGTVILTGILTVLLYVPVLLRSGAESVIGNAFVQPLDWETFIAGLPVSLAHTWQFWTRDIPPLLSMILNTAVIGAVVFNHRVSRYTSLLIIAGVPFALMIAGRANVLPRMWLWLLPLGLVAAAGGVMGLLERLPSVRPFLPIIILLLCAGLCLATVTAHMDQPFGDVVIEPDSQAIVEYIKAHYQPADNYVIVPASAPLIYYFVRHGLSTDHLGDELPDVDAAHLLVVVLEPDYTIESMLTLLQRFGLTDDYDAPIQIAQFSSSSLWELSR